MIYVNPVCGRCGRRFAHPADRPVPGVAYCRPCSALIDAAIQRSLYCATGYAVGGHSAAGGYVPPT